MVGCNPCQVPMEACLKLSKWSMEKTMNITAYWSIVESLRYLVNTYPDLIFFVGYVCRFLEEPREDHVSVVQWILPYVVGTNKWELWIGKKKGN